MTERKKIGRFHVVELLKSGDFSSAYLCVDPDLGSRVVAKMFNPRCRVARYPQEVWRERFLEEARLMARLEHPNIVRLIGFGRDQEQTPYFVMPYLPGNLRSLLGRDISDATTVAALPPEKRPKRLPPHQAVPILYQALSGLNELHRQGILHRDIKPHNLLLTQTNGGAVKLSDFTIARIPGKPFTRDKGWLGSPNYIAPEQRDCIKNADARADVYAIGATAFRMMTGILYKTSSTSVSDLAPAVAPGMSRWVQLCLSENPNDRPADAAEALQRLQDAAK